MMDVARDSRVLSLVGRPGLRNTLTTLLDQLQRCQKALNEFLEVRNFSRFIQINQEMYSYPSLFVTSLLSVLILIFVENST